MATIEAEIDINDYLGEADTENLIAELESRDYECIEGGSNYNPEQEYLENLSGYQLRNHLLTITMQGGWVSDEMLFEALKERLGR